MKRYQPDPSVVPPGYVFVSNHGGYDHTNKRDWSELDIAGHMANRLLIPVEAFLVLRGVVPHGTFTSFVTSDYSARIEEWTNDIAAIIKLFLALEKLEDAQ